jgi:dihydrofolate reductase
MILSIIAAYAKDKDGARVIGRDNQMPWHFPHDLERFKEYTREHVIIMGRKTHESIGRVLPKRDNIIVTRQKDYAVEGAFVFADLEEAISFAAGRNSEIFIIGGQDLYEQTIDRADRLYLTSFKIEDVDGDTYFPDFNSNLFKMIYIERAQISGDCFRILDRKIPQPIQTPVATSTSSESEPEISGLDALTEVANPSDLDYIYGGYVV